MIGVVLAYCNSTGDWPFWAYGWSLVTPGGVGLGMYLQALRDRDQHALRTGRTLLFISLMEATRFLRDFEMLPVSDSQFAQIRLMVVGVVLVLVMQRRPQGLWPYRHRSRRARVRAC